MNRLFMFMSILLTCIASSAKAEEPMKLVNENARINYSVGYQVGSDFKRQGVEIDTEILARAVEAVFLSGAEPAMTPKEMRKELTELQRRVTTARKATAEKEAVERREAGQKFLEDNKTKEGVKVTDSGLQYKILEPGNGKQPAPTDTVRVNYRGTLVDGSEFDSSYKRGKPAEFRLDGVIKGWTEGLQLMKEGGKAQFFIPPELAYGDSGRLGNQTLIFEVELLSVVAPEGGDGEGITTE